MSSTESISEQELVVTPAIMSKDCRPGFKPRDVAPEEASKILDRLNALNSAEEIAGSIAESYGRRVLSLRVAKRIFKNRVALGRFQDLHQVAAIPGIGTKKLTAIIHAFSDLAPGIEMR